MSSRFHIIVPPQSELHRKEIQLRIKQLRAVCSTEVWFHGIAETLKYLDDIGVRRAHDLKVTEDVLLTWRRKLGFPWGNFRDGFKGLKVLNTSNVMIMAWLWSLPVYNATRPRAKYRADRADVLAHLVDHGAE